MDAAITINLTLEQVQCLRGESLFFTVTVENTSGAGLPDVPTLEPHNHVLELTVRSRERTLRADALSADEREGSHVHRPEEPQTKRLNAGESFQLRGDLLEWFGELPPDSYEVTAAYSGLLETVQSKPTKLKVLPANIVLASTPRYGQAMPDARLTAAWVHKGENDFVPFYQRQGANLPRNPRRGLRVAGAPSVTEIWAAVLCHSGSQGHLLWCNQKDKLFLATLDADAPKVGSPAELKVPFSGSPLLSPLTMQNGGVLVPYVDAKKQKLAILNVGAGEAPPSADLDLNPAAPLGPYVCLWDYGARLHFLWAAAAGRDVHYARLPLTERAAAFTSRAAYQATDPVVWLDAYVDVDATFADEPYFEEQVPEDQRERLSEEQPPPLMLWSITNASGRVVCTRVNLANDQSKVEAGFSLPAGVEPRVLSSVVTQQHGLALLLADAQDRLYYASTMRGALVPIAEAARTEVTAQQFPGLMTASESGLEPWVYLRYVDRKAAIVYARLEPPNEPDPIDRSTTTRP